MITSSDQLWNITEHEKEFDEESPILDDAVLEVIERLLITSLHALTSVSGVLTNALNVVVFVSLGIRDSMSVGIVALTATELFMSGSELLITVCYFVHYNYAGSPVDLFSVAFIVLGWIRYPGFFISSWITTFISVERCISVVCPFKVKQIFTKKRGIAIVLCICAFNICIVVPIFASLTVYWRVDLTHAFNDTVIEKAFFTFAYTDLTSKLEMIIDTACAVTLSIISQLILIICTVLMIQTLKSTCRIRRWKDTDADSKATKNIGWLKCSAMSEKERKMVKVTLGLALVITSVNIPRYVHYTLFYALFSSDLVKFRGVAFLFFGISDFVIALYSSCNFVVYYMLNTKFKNRLRKLLC